MENQQEQQVERRENTLSPLLKVTPFSKYFALTLFIVLPFLGALIGYWYGLEKIVGFEYRESLNKSLGSEKRNVDWSTRVDKVIAEKSTYINEQYPDSNIDIKAVLQQVSDLTLITAALQAHKKRMGVYPLELEDLLPQYLPETILSSQTIPTDVKDEPFYYEALEGGYGYLICHYNLIEGGRDCFGENKQGEFDYRVLGDYYISLVTDEVFYYTGDGVILESLVLIEGFTSSEFQLYKEDLYSRYATDGVLVYIVDNFDPFCDCPNELRILNEADPDTFEPYIVSKFNISQGNTYQAWISRDKEKVFYQNTVIEGADAKTFRVGEDVPINYDAENVFLYYKIIPDADPNTYQVIFHTGTEGRGKVFGKDATSCFFEYQKINCEQMPATSEEAQKFEL